LLFTTVFRNFNLNQNQIITYLEKINENQSIIGGGGINQTTMILIFLFKSQNKSLFLN
jgi:hypothetical protein